MKLNVRGLFYSTRITESVYLEKLKLCHHMNRLHEKLATPSDGL
jgi:hypothetical protein